MQIKDLAYETDFIWKGKRYTQFIRPKQPKGAFTVLCYPTREPDGDTVNMPSGRKVKPVLKIKDLQI